MIFEKWQGSQTRCFPASGRRAPEAIWVGGVLQKESVDNVHTLGLRTWSYRCRTGAYSACFLEFQYYRLQGPESGSSPTSGTHSPSSEGVLLVCVDIDPPRVPLTLAAGCAWGRGGL
jgi:hypothetical protein